MAAQIDVSFTDRLLDDGVSHVTAALLHSPYFAVTSVSSPFSQGGAPSAISSTGPSLV